MTQTSTASFRTAGDRSFTVDGLARMSVTELEDIYRAGSLFDIDALDGAPPGRMLTVVGPLGWMGMRKRIAAFARSNVFPWEGKSFSSTTKTAGGGINRVALLGEKYPFATRVEPSAIDGKPCVLLDYRQPENPFFIAAIRDELREVAPGLYLGPAMVERAGRPARLALWFAIDKTGH